MVICEGYWPWERESSVIYRGSWHWEREPRVIYEGSLPWERASSVNYEGSWSWERESLVICEGSRPCEREPSVLYEGLAFRVRIKRKVRGIAALGARTQCNLRGFAASGPALDFQEMAGGCRKALPEYISQYRKVLVSALERGGPFWATSARFFATLGARTQRNLRGIVALGVRMPRNLRGIVALGARPQRNLRGIVIQGA